ncbi:MAG: flavin reductase family protein [Candidatus Geothermarchaeales archaeon]
MKMGDFYKLTVRPTVVITTVSKNGISNAAPFSWSSPLSIEPPLFGFSCNEKHDTWRNIRENKEFVVNLVGEAFGPLMHILEMDFPYEVSEIGKAGLTEEKSRRVQPPRIGEAFAWLECKMIDHLQVANYIWIVGEILEVEAKPGSVDEVLNVEKVKPLNHIYGGYFVTEMKTTKFKRAK